jgi:hypothetical protein
MSERRTMNPDDDPIDFSPLDPARDARRWRQLSDEVVAHAVAALRPSLTLQLVAWLRPAMAGAAAVAVVVWAGSLLADRPARESSREQPAWALVGLPTNCQALSAWQVVAALEGDADAAR